MFFFRKQKRGFIFVGGIGLETDKTKGTIFMFGNQSKDGDIPICTTAYDELN